MAGGKTVVILALGVDGACLVSGVKDTRGCAGGALVGAAVGAGTGFGVVTAGIGGLMRRVSGVLSICIGHFLLLFFIVICCCLFLL